MDQDLNQKLNLLADLLIEEKKKDLTPMITIRSKEDMQLHGKLAKKMSSVIAKSGKVEKKGINKDQHYKFASHSDIIEELRKIISEEGIYILPKPDSYKTEEISSKFGTKGANIFMSMDFEIIDTDTGYSMTSRWVGQGMDYGDKAIYKSYTGALKYFLLDTFMISTGDDPENDAPESHYPQTPRAPYQASKTPRVTSIVKVTPEQEARIEKLMSVKGKSENDINMGIANYPLYKKQGITKWKELNKIQAEGLIKQLEKMPDLQPEGDVEAPINEPEIDPEEAARGIEEMKKSQEK